MATGNPVVDAILAATSNQEIREAMLLGSNLESSWNPTAVGDGGTSFGPFQMHEGGALTSSGLTPAQAEDPPLAVKAMLGAYTAAVNSIPQSLWSANPEQAAEQAAVAAERPAQTYFAARGTATVDAAWLATENALKGIVSSPGAPGGNASTTGADITNPLSPSSWISALPGLLGLPDLKDGLQRLGLILLGGALILLGLFLLVGKDSFKTTIALVPGGAEIASGMQAVSGKGKNLGKNTGGGKTKATAGSAKPSASGVGKLEQGAGKAVSVA